MNPNLELLAAAKSALHALTPGIKFSGFEKAEIRRRLADAIAAVGRNGTPSFEVWREEQLSTLRLIYNQRGATGTYQSFPDFCLAQWEGASERWKVAV